MAGPTVQRPGSRLSQATKSQVQKLKASGVSAAKVQKFRTELRSAGVSGAEKRMVNSFSTGAKSQHAYEAQAVRSKSRTGRPSGMPKSGGNKTPSYGGGPNTA